MRIYPHLQDSGGFFVAAIQRSESPRSSKGLEKVLLVEEPEAEAEPQTEVAEPPVKRQKVDLTKRYVEKKKEDELNMREVVPEMSEGIVGETGGQFKEDPYTFVSPGRTYPE